MLLPELELRNNYNGAAPYVLDVLNHGFVALRNISGPTRRAFDAFEGTDGFSGRMRPFDADDIDPANAARMSFDQTDTGRTREQDLRLAEYLMKNKHTSPFEMIEVWVEMKMPIFVARQLVRHRTASLNEVSGRYVELPAEWYIPDLGSVMLQVDDKKQGGRPVNLDDEVEYHKAIRAQIRLDDDCRRSYDNYLEAVADGIAMEQARCHLHLNHYTHWLWKQDLHNLMHLLSLRDHGHAQGETNRYAQAIDKLVRQHLPHSMELYDKYRRLG